MSRQFGRRWGIGSAPNVSPQQSRFRRGRPGTIHRSLSSFLNGLACAPAWRNEWLAAPSPDGGCRDLVAAYGTVAGTPGRRRAGGGAEASASRLRRGGRGVGSSVARFGCGDDLGRPYGVASREDVSVRFRFCAWRPAASGGPSAEVAQLRALGRSQLHRRGLPAGAPRPHPRSGERSCGSTRDPSRPGG